MDRKYFTIVMNVKDHDKFIEFLDECSPHFASDSSDFYGSRITGMGWEDSMTKLDRLRDFCEGEGIDIPEDLL